MPPAVVLLDLDGVCIRPGGYREALRKTFRHFFQQIGMESLVPGEDIPLAFEAAGITSEWDMVPIILASVLEGAAAYWDIGHYSDLSKVFTVIRDRQLPISSIDYHKVIGALQRNDKTGAAPVERLLQLCVENPARCPFPRLAMSPLIKMMFQGTRDVRSSVTTRVFQQFALGSDIFEEVYELAVEVHSGSCLREFDQALVNADAVQLLMQKRQEKEIFPAILTARPSLPPREIINQPVAGYSPEAELAVEHLGLGKVPLIGYGRLQYIAEQHGLDVETLLKPAPFQALAAIVAAWGGDELEGLNAALGWISPSLDSPIVDGAQSVLPERFSVHVFEDSPIGIVATREAIRILNTLGYKVRYFAWGVATDRGKIESLEAAGASVFPDVNLAVSAFIEVISYR